MMARRHSFLVFCSTMSSKSNVWWTILGPETDSSSIERLRGSVVVHNVLGVGVIQHPELRQLGPGDLEGREEVVPLHHLIAARSGQRALVSAVSGGSGGTVDRSHGLQEVNQLQ